MDIPFSIPVTGVIHLDGDKVTITVNRAEHVGPRSLPGNVLAILKTWPRPEHG